MANNVFVSYHHDVEDELHKNLLVAWSENDAGHFNIKFQDKSVGVSINSADAYYIKSVIKRRIIESPVFLCLIGKNTAESAWVSWEIEQAVSLGKKIVAVKIKSFYDSPIALYGVGAKWAQSFHYGQIKRALDN